MLKRVLFISSTGTTDYRLLLRACSSAFQKTSYSCYVHHCIDSAQVNPGFLSSPPPEEEPEHAGHGDKHLGGMWWGGGGWGVRLLDFLTHDDSELHSNNCCKRRRANDTACMIICMRSFFVFACVRPRGKIHCAFGSPPPCPNISTSTCAFPPECVRWRTVGTA